MLKEDAANLGAEGPHQAQRAPELQHRPLGAECVTQHTLFHEETHWPGCRSRGGFPKLGNQTRHSLTACRYDRESGKQKIGKAPAHQMID